VPKGVGGNTFLTEGDDVGAVWRQPIEDSCGLRCLPTAIYNGVDDVVITTINILKQGLNTCQEGVNFEQLTLEEGRVEEADP
jgi:hydrogenase maturation factor HypE